jgi:hypothetical protein
MNAPNENQVIALLRHAGTFAAGIATATTISGVKPETAKAAIDAIQHIVNGMSEAVSGSYALLVIIGPGIYAAMSWYSSRSASIKSQQDAVTDTGAKILTTPALAAANSNPSVLSTADAKLVTK